VATYEYGPFGAETTRIGTVATIPIRLSAKYEDDETRFLYYGYRYYSPSTERWLNRDPIEENGGINEYGFLHNDNINRFDLLGLQSFQHIFEKRNYRKRNANRN